jgi:hypothetical protein
MLMRTAAESIATAKAFVELKTSISDITDNVPQFIKSIETVLDATKEIPDTDYFVKMIQKGELSKIQDMTKAVRVIQDLPKLAEGLQKDIVKVVRFISTFSTQSQQLVTAFQDIIDTTWESYPMEFTTDSSGNVRAGVMETQALVREEILGPLRNVTSSFEEVQRRFQELPFKGGGFQHKVGVASYRRWNDISFKMPCLTTGYQKFSAGGMEKEFPYPKFYSCDYKDELHWPNHHIPYIKFRIG